MASRVPSPSIILPQRHVQRNKSLQSDVSGSTLAGTMIIDLHWGGMLMKTDNIFLTLSLLLYVQINISCLGK